MKRATIVLSLTALMPACAGVGWPVSHSFGDLHRPVTTPSPQAQEHFDRGLVLAFGFNHDEAARQFARATELDPHCAMAWWGIAYCLAPNINLPLEDKAVALRGHRAAQRALAESEHATPVERALIGALAARFADPPPDDRSHLDVAYADAMRRVWQQHPDDPDVGVLFADAMLNLRPWDQWTPEGDPQPGTLELVAALEDVLAEHPEHPGANHLYIHAVEASTTPERAAAAADRLRDLDITAAGHLVHMPSHIYIRTGRYAEAAEANARAVEADRAYMAAAGPQGIYELYKAHNHHFQMYASMFLGDRETTLRAAREGAAEISPSVLEHMAPFADCYLPMTLHGMIRFGMWEEILQEPEFGAQFPIAVASRHYARGIALANLDRPDEAAAEAAELERTAALIPEDALIVGTPARPVMEVAKLMLRGEMLFREGEYDEAFAALRKAVEAEDALPYDEPRGWMQPVRHALGALLLQRGEVAEAEQVYRADLAIHPNNGWSLHGLAECLRARGDVAEAAAVGDAFDAAWSEADVDIAASCYCRTK